MPELPEVETVVRGLHRTILGRTITKIRVQAPPSSIVVSRSFNGAGFEACLRRRRIESVTRRGKNILIGLSGDVTLWVHLKMTGRFQFVAKKEPTDRHHLVVFDLAAGNASGGRQLRFRDTRRFGRLRVFRDDELWRQKGLAELGPEPLQISPKEFVTLFKSSRRMIKPALLDQTFLAGLGNIYADEALYLSRIHPRRLTSTLSAGKLIELHGHIQTVLNKAIRLMGTTVFTFSGVNRRSGSFQKHLNVYGKEGEPCIRCGAAIVRERIGSRSAHFCPRCQRQR
ncbi:MAG TPA: DNA-formamidopyrimidine glycosylase [Candidatus Deferrimicrobium sp.]|nr:DNA-formamidopyrimidine glycosylase [Candidatus Deferrimicrobium sp.]